MCHECVPKPLSHQRSCILQLDRWSSLHAMYKVHELCSQQLGRLKEEETLVLLTVKASRLCAAQVSTMGRPTAPRALEVRSVAESCSKTAFSHLLTMSCSITNHTNVGRLQKGFLALTQQEQQRPETRRGTTAMSTGCRSTAIALQQARSAQQQGKRGPHAYPRPM